MYGHGKGAGEESVEMEGHVGSLWDSPAWEPPGEMGWAQCGVQVPGDVTGCPRFQQP